MLLVFEMKTFVKIYGKFTLNEIKRQFVYKGSFYLFIVCSMFASFTNFFLWKAIYSNSKRAIIGGLSQNEMIVYVFISYITSTVVMIDVSRYINNDVIKGNISMSLIKPINYRNTLIAKAFGNFIYHFFVPNIVIGIAIEIVKVFFLKINMISIKQLTLYLLSIFFSFLVYVLFDYILGIISFFTNYIFGLSLAKIAIISFFSGSLIPLSFFPKVIRLILEILPFSAMTYDPIMIYIGKYSNNYILYIYGKQIFWIVVLYGLGELIWNLAIKKMVILGG
ncbi:ABC transporter permease [Anaerosacchariphilus polymeriproducens]|uniref:ABC transporter permease n=1 Tax=Anaerosacchariphilus polymeriproducens TaxID=1812858 RepID=A0A371AS30_9FIRM|nr:ABC-2 family transporter protein [Anaerosacchariphilus polymeriproducens]RDU22377.1 hypothetical protein DWV06_13855 [Anaerosacchariphilus polymeriproducens]